MQIKTLLLDYLKVDKAKYVTAALVVIIGVFDYVKLRKQLAVERTKTRQAEGYLSQEERDLIAQNEALNLANSNLVVDVAKFKKDAKTNREKYQKSLKDFDKFNEENNLLLQEFRSTIHTLKQKVTRLKNTPPQTKIVVKEGKCEENTTVGYSFTDRYSRLTFHTPNCLKDGNETYSLNQAFSIYGEAHQQADGLLRTNSMNLNELDPNDHTKVIATANLVSSDIRYVPLDIPKVKYEKLTLGFGLDHNLKTNINAGYNIFHYSKFYLNAGINLSSNQDLFPSFNVIYRPDFLSKPLNLGLSTGAGYDFDVGFNYLLGLSFFAW